MIGMRCEDCGEVRWSVLGRSDINDAACPLCGSRMIPERRQPGRRPPGKAAERRDAEGHTPVVRAR